jgi:hypothetical protein
VLPDTTGCNNASTFIEKEEQNEGIREPKPTIYVHEDDLIVAGQYIKKEKKTEKYTFNLWD